MKILLTHTYFIEEDEQEQKIMKPYPPLGLLYLSAYLKQNDIDVEVYDTTFSSFRALIEYLNKAKPDVLGIHCNLLTKFNVLKLIDFCRAQGVVSILGGPDASTQVEKFLNYGADVLVSGEGEIPLLQIVKKLKTGSKHELHEIANVSFRDREGKIVQNAREIPRRSLNSYPLPDRRAIDMDKYLDTWETHHGQRSVSLVTARGCAFTCKWCSHSVYGWTHRRRSPENVLEEIRQIIEEYRPTHLWFADDVFTVNKHWIRKFHRLMQAADIHLPFECISRADRLDEELVVLLKELGCYRIWFGAESGSQRILDAMSRGVTRAQIEEAVRLCRENEIEAGVFVMFGYPGEELTDIHQTIDFISRLQPEHYLSTVAYPLRGTTLYNEVKEQIVANGNWRLQLQRELDIRNRFTRQLYEFAAKKLASDYRRIQLKHRRQEPLKQFYHSFRSVYAGRQMRRLAHLRT